MQGLFATITSISDWEKPLRTVLITVVVVLILGHLSHLLWMRIREYQVSQAAIKTREVSAIDGSRKKLHMAPVTVASRPHSFQTVGPWASTG